LHTDNGTPRYVRCLDSTLHMDVMTIGEVYEVTGEEHGNYRVCGRWMLKARFEPVSLTDDQIKYAHELAEDRRRAWAAA
jgi:hypothetical protein